MRKRFLILFPLILMLIIGPASAVKVPKGGMRGVWVASIYNIDYPSAQGLSPEELMRQADEILDNVANMGLNTVFLQVRPSADALYPSEYFPWSRYLTGTTGTAPADDFDPLAYWVQAAHARGLELHAWINPFRITKDGDSEWESLPDSSPAKQHPEWVVKYDGNYYFDPGLSAVRRLVLNGATEIITNYDVDGIHLDDYFYPGTDFNDSVTYERYGDKFDNIEDWRRDNINQLIRMLDQTLHNIDPDIAFGVSPAGIWDNKSSNPRGSDTNGRSSYSEIYCDSLQWIESGTVDYICPQLYWAIGFEAADFSVLIDWWQDAVSTSDVALYIGIGAYRMAEASPGDVWYGTEELLRQLELIDHSIDIQGEVYYNYSSLMETSDCASVLTDYYAERDGITPSKPNNTATSLGQFFSQFILALFH